MVAQLAGHEARDLRLGPVGQQGLVKQELHSRGVLVLADVQGVDGMEMAVFISAVLLWAPRASEMAVPTCTVVL